MDITSGGDSEEGSHLACPHLSARDYSLGGEEKGKGKSVAVSGWVLLEKRDVWIGNIFISREGQIELNCSVVLLAIEVDSPVFPTEGRIHIHLVKVVLIDNSTFRQQEQIPLSDLAVRSNSADRLLHFGISVARPITVSLFASADPLSLPIYKISERDQINCSQSRAISGSIGGIVKLNGQIIHIEMRVTFLFKEGDLFY